MEHVGVFLLDMPAGIRGLTVKNDDGSYTVIINAGLSHQMQKETYSHEIAHIDNKDYDKMYDINVLEFLRH